MRRAAASISCTTNCMHNLVLETTRLGIEVKNLKMRVESLTSRLEFNERRARALESVVVYKRRRAGTAAARGRAPHAGAGDAAIANAPPPRSEAARREPAAPAAETSEGPGQRSRRRRRRRGRRGGGLGSAIMGGPPGAGDVRAGGLTPSAKPSAATTAAAESIEHGRWPPTRCPDRKRTIQAPTKQ